MGATAAASYEARAGSCVELRRRGDARIDAPRELRHACQRVDDPVARRGRVVRPAGGSGDRDDLGPGIRIVVEPAPDRDAAQADRRHA